MGSRAGCAVNDAKGKQPTLALPTMEYLARLLDWLDRMLCAQLGRIMNPNTAAFDSVFTVRVACSMPRVVWH